MLGSAINIAFSALVVVLTISGHRWVQPKTSISAFLALAYSWYAMTTVWAANTKSIEQLVYNWHTRLYPSATFWLTFLPQALSCLSICLITLLRGLASKFHPADPHSSPSLDLSPLTWCIAGAAFFFGQLFTVGGLGVGTPGLVFAVKVLEPLTTSMLAIPVLGQRLDWRLLAAIAVACGGIALTVLGNFRGHGAQDLQGTVKAIVGAVFANIAFSSRACIVKKAFSQKKIPPLETFLRVNLAAAVCGLAMLLIWLLNLAHHVQTNSAGLLAVCRELITRPRAWFITCFAYFLYQCSSLLLLDCLLVESHALLVALKHVCVVIMASVLSGSSINALMIIGIVVASLGVFLYSVGPAQDGSAKALLGQDGTKLKEPSAPGVSHGLALTVAGVGLCGILSPLLYL